MWWTTAKINRENDAAKARYFFSTSEVLTEDTFWNWGKINNGLELDLPHLFETRTNSKNFFLQKAIFRQNNFFINAQFHNLVNPNSYLHISSLRIWPVLNFFFSWIWSVVTKYLKNANCQQHKIVLFKFIIIILNMLIIIIRHYFPVYNTLYWWK